MKTIAQYLKIEDALFLKWRGRVEEKKRKGRKYLSSSSSKSK